MQKDCVNCVCVNNMQRYHGIAVISTEYWTSFASRSVLVCYYLSLVRQDKGTSETPAHHTWSYKINYSIHELHKVWTMRIFLKDELWYLFTKKNWSNFYTIKVIFSNVFILLQTNVINCVKCIYLDLSFNWNDLQILEYIFLTIHQY